MNKKKAIDKKYNLNMKLNFKLIYIFKVLDLLNPSPKSLNVRWAKDRGFYAENLFKVECEDIGDLEGVLEEGLLLIVIF